MIEFNKIILKNASSCTTHFQLAKSLNITYQMLHYHLNKQNLVKQIKQTLKSNYNNSKNQSNTTKILDLSKTCSSYQEIANKLNLTRERVRQILLEIDPNQNIKHLLNYKRHEAFHTYPGIYYIYFKNDPKKSKFYIASHNIQSNINNRFKRNYLYPKDPKFKSAYIKFKKINMSYEILEKLPIIQSKQKVNQLIINDPNCLNHRPFLSKQEYKIFLKEYYQKRAKPPKKSKHKYIYFHRFSNKWISRIPDLSNHKIQNHLGYFKTEQQAINSIKIYLSFFKLQCPTCHKSWSPTLPQHINCNCGSKQYPIPTKKSI